MPRKLRTLLLTLVAVVVLALVALIALTVSRPPPLPPLPNPNGYDTFIQADKLLGNLGNETVNTTWEMEFERLRGFIATNAEPVRLMQLGLSQTCSVPTLEVLTNLAQRYNYAPNRLAQFWFNAGRLAEWEGRTNDAARIYTEGICFATKINHGGFLFYAWSSCVCESFPSRALARLVPTLDCEQARKLIATLEQCDQNAASWDEVWSNEKRFLRHELRKPFTPLECVQFLVSLRVNREFRFTHYAVTARRRLILTELALRCYQAEKAQPPRQLAQLVPKYLQRVPQDPFSSQPLIYRPQTTNWLLYSVGPDGKDDGGRPMSGIMRNPPPPGDVFFNSR